MENMLKPSCMICTYGAPVLRKKSMRITAFDAALSELAHSMLERMYGAHGVGLAAPQIGELIQLVVIDLQQAGENELVFQDGRSLPISLVQPLYLVNPSYTPIQDLQVEYEEGCLSLPNVRGKVKRFFEIVCTYQDLEGNAHKLQCKDWLSCCIQHECDHLNGILFIDHLSKAERNEQRELLKEIQAFGGQFDYATLTETEA